MCLVFIDDVIIYSSSYNKYLEHIEKVLQRLDEVGWTIQPSKSDFARTCIEFFGHVLDQNGIHTAFKKVAAVTTYDSPRNAKEVQSLLGMAGYYRTFVPMLSIIAKSLHNCRGTEYILKWELRTFKELKQKLTTKPGLVRWDPTATLQVHTDACKVGSALPKHEMAIGSDRPTVFMSEKLFDTQQRNYNVTEMEAFAVLKAVHTWSCYLGDPPFKIFTDHRALLWLEKHKDIEEKTGEWALTVAQQNNKFNKKVQYKK